MTGTAKREIRRADYSPPAWWVDTVDLDVDIRKPWATVRSRLAMRRNTAVPRACVTLDGAHHELLDVAIDGRSLAASAYRIESERLTIPDTPDSFTLETIVRFDPWQNTRLEGFYASGDGLFTQCEAEGFRAITWFPDRPDVMATYRVTLHGDRETFPQLLSNGNLVAQGEEADGRHWCTWEDPFPKPCYLFAMVAARLDVLEDHFTTRSGKRALLQVYVDPGRREEATFTMECLKHAMRWDEGRFGLELDLDRFMIVAVSAFNMGAMENKGLNLFNAKYVLASPETATDTDYVLIDRIVAHEYFHNWTGNRVTCRDWFQLTLKEGLTVYRDQEYGRDRHSRSVNLIQDVRDLRERQFPEDAGPMAHPVRPDAYTEINNFYTMTVYEKGAEVVRLYETILGREGFRRGMDLYFKRHDGQAVTCDDFRAAMAEANGADLSLLERWYAQAGTPVVHASGAYDAANRTYTLELRQSCPQTLGMPPTKPFPIPVAIGLVGKDGRDVPLSLGGAVATQPSRPNANATTFVHLLARESETLVFQDVPEPPTPSLLRGHSAPVLLDYDYSDEDLIHLFAHDSDPFNRWEAGQRLATRVLIAAAKSVARGGEAKVPEAFSDAFGLAIERAGDDPAFAAECLQLPAENYLADQMDEPDPDAIHAARDSVLKQLAAQHRSALEGVVADFTVSGPYSPDAGSIGRRALRNIALATLGALDDAATRALLLSCYRSAANMTDEIAALCCLADSAGPEREESLGAFYAKWRHEPLVVDKWFRAQATSAVSGRIDRIRKLAARSDFDIAQPNRARAVLHAFALENPSQFHAASGEGYRFVAEKVIELDRINPQVAARLARAFDRWRRYDAVRQAHARASLESIARSPSVSADVGEIAGKALG